MSSSIAFLFFFRVGRGLSLSLQFADLAKLDSQKALGILLPLLPLSRNNKHRPLRSAFFVGVGTLNPCLCASVAIPTDLSPQALAMLAVILGVYLNYMFSIIGSRILLELFEGTHI